MNENIQHFRWFTSTTPKYPNWELNLVGSGKIFYVEIMNNDKSIHQFNISKHFADAEINFEYIKNKMQNNQDINLKDFSDFKNNKLNNQN
jgi:hypothetical protein